MYLLVQRNRKIVRCFCDTVVNCIALVSYDNVSCKPLFLFQHPLEELQLSISLSSISFTISVNAFFSGVFVLDGSGRPGFTGDFEVVSPYSHRHIQHSFVELKINNSWHCNRLFYLSISTKTKLLTLLLCDTREITLTLDSIIRQIKHSPFSSDEKSSYFFQLFQNNNQVDKNVYNFYVSHITHFTCICDIFV